MSYFPQIVNNGGLKSEGGTNEPSVMFGGTTMFRPRRDPQVGQTHIRRDVVMAFTREPGQARKRTARLGAMDASGFGAEKPRIITEGYACPPMTCPL